MFRCLLDKGGKMTPKRRSIFFANFYSQLYPLLLLLLILLLLLLLLLLLFFFFELPCGVIL